jgi:hypothetical protein
MSGRIRTTKQLARRINKEYYQKLASIPRWRRLLSLILTVLGLSWIAYHAFARDSSIYSSGALTKAHASFGGQCGACHQGGGIAKTIADTQCLSCHDGPVHSVRQVSTPACAECHVEHQGHDALMVASDKVCVNCHASLKTKTGVPTVAAAIHSFGDGHPEFTLPKRDPGHIKYNHKVHLQKNLRGLSGFVTLQCGDCHRPTGIGAAANAAENVSSPRPSRAYMAPITYEGQCASCHPLEFDPRLTEVAPHKDPPVVHDFLVAKFGEYIQLHPELLPESAGAQRIIRQKIDPLAGSAREWVLLRVADSERLLWTKTCVQCHQMTAGAQGSLPRVEPSNVTARWLKQGNFDHFAHGAVDCGRCHTASVSETASDVLIPGSAVCKECHGAAPMGAALGTAGTAGTKCTECHQYHDWTKEKDVRHSKVGT